MNLETTHFFKTKRITFFNSAYLNAHYFNRLPQCNPGFSKRPAVINNIGFDSMNLQPGFKREAKRCLFSRVNRAFLQTSTKEP